MYRQTYSTLFVKEMVCAVCIWATLQLCDIFNVTLKKAEWPIIHIELHTPNNNLNIQKRYNGMGDMIGE